jgi:hypothetical protein
MNYNDMMIVMSTVRGVRRRIYSTVIYIVIYSTVIYIVIYSTVIYIVIYSIVIYTVIHIV